MHCNFETMPSIYWQEAEEKGKMLSAGTCAEPDACCRE